MSKTIAIILAVLSITAFGLGIVTVASLSSPAVLADGEEANCGNVGQPPCECLQPNPPPYCPKG